MAASASFTSVSDTLLGKRETTRMNKHHSPVTTIKLRRTPGRDNLDLRPTSRVA